MTFTVWFCSNYSPFSVPHLPRVIMQWQKLKPPEPDDPLCCCECEDLDEAFTRWDRRRDQKVTLKCR